MKTAKNVLVLAFLTFSLAMVGCNAPAEKEGEDTASVEEQDGEKKACCKDKEECDEKRAAGECGDDKEECEKPCCKDNDEDKAEASTDSSEMAHECTDECKEGECEHHASVETKACADDCEKPCCKEA